MDNSFTMKMQRWLQKPRGQKSLEDGATMLLQLNRNRFMHASILRLQLWEKLEYELNKYLRIRLDGMTAEAIERMQREVMPSVERTLLDEPNVTVVKPVIKASGRRKLKDIAPVAEISTDADHTNVAKVAKGRRGDHDSLPEEIQKLWDDNAEVWFRIKALYNHLLTMENALPCDRYEYLKQLAELDKRYHDNLAKYDAYKA